MFWYFGLYKSGISVPWPGIEPTPSALEGEVLTTRLPGKFPGSDSWGVISLSGYLNGIPQ